ncbi:T9SS type A sorting domain-containing protein [Fulvivirgaceae bacterium LMO-SS25]
MKRHLLLTLFIFCSSFSLYAQLSDVHYMPPLKQRAAAIVNQSIILSTPETTPFNVNVFQGTNTTAVATISISNTSSGTYALGDGDNNITLVTDTNTGTVLSTSGLRFESAGGQKFYVNYRGRSGNQATSIVSKGRQALGTAFKWGGVPNRGTSYTVLNTTMGIMATEDNTTVTIFGYDPAVTFRLGADPVGLTDNSITVNLDAGETYVLETIQSASNPANIDGWLGASISSNKNIAVNVGSMHVQPSVINNQDAGADQIIPENAIGQEYIFVRGNGVDATEFALVVATQNNTEIYVNGSSTPIATINNGDYYQIPSNLYSASSPSGSNPGANLLVTTSKAVYAFQSLAGSTGTQTSDVNFIAPVNCLLDNKVDNIPDITNIAGLTMTGGITIIASTAISDEDIIVTSGGSTLPTSTITAAKRSVAGSSDWNTFYLSGLSGNVSVNATGPIAVGFFGVNNNAGVSGYFSGFDTVPIVRVNVTNGGCLPDAFLEVTPGFNSYAWYRDGVLIPGVTSTTYTPTQAGDYYVVVTKGSCTYQSAVQSIYDCNPEVVVTHEVDKTVAQEGETVTFSISVRNLGFDPVTNIEVSQSLPAGFTLVSAVPSFGTWTAPNWTIGTMFSGENHVLTVTATVDAVVTEGLLTNTVSITQDQVDTNSIPDVLSASVNTIFNAISWTGVSSDDGEVGGNWNGGSVPNPGDNILIPDLGPGANYPVFEQDVSLGSVTIEDNATLTIAPGYGLTVSSGSTITIGEGGRLILKSDATGTAYIGTLTGGCTITGTVRQERHIIGSNRTFRFMGHPFSSAVPLSVIGDKIDITGSGAGFTPTSTNNPSAFYYDPSTGDADAEEDGGWKAFTGMADNWNRHQGIRVLVRGPKGQENSLLDVEYTPDPVTFEWEGEVNTCDQIINLAYYEPFGGVSDFNLVGNPFPAAINLQNIGRTAQVGTSYWVWLPRESNVGVSGRGGRYINTPFTAGTDEAILPVGGAFFVRAGAAGQSLTIRETDKTNANEPLQSVAGTTLRRDADVKSLYGSNSLQLSLSSSEDEWDRVLVFFDESTTSTVEQTDGTKLVNPEVNLFTVSEDDFALSIDSRPYQEAEGVETNTNRIPLHILSPARAYTLSLPDFDLEEGRTLRLYDRFTEEYITLQKGTTYDFEVTDDPRTKGHRFDIVMGIEVITSIHPSNHRFQAYLLPNPAQEQVRISIQKPDNVGETTVKIVSMTGVEVSNEKLTTDTSELDINLSQLSKGIYLVEITHGTERIVKRLIVN